MKEFIIFAILLVSLYEECEAKLTESELRNVLQNIYDPKRTKLMTAASIASWNHETDLNNKKKDDIQLKTQLASAEFQKEMWKKYFHDLDPDDYTDPHLKRHAKFLRLLGDYALDNDKLTKFNQVTSNMTSIYSTAKICPFHNQKCDPKKEGLQLEPDLVSIFSNSTDYNELQYYWQQWRDATGAKMKKLFKIYVDLSNESAKINKFHDRGELWRYDFESPDFVADMDRLWKQIEPLYIELHKYVGRKLKKVYGDKLDISDGYIPAHVLGNMWAQSWTPLAHLLKPYPEASTIDGDGVLRKNNFTVERLFTTADDFYQSMGLIPNGMSYDESKGAMIRKPKDGREVVCHASAWDMGDGKDFRIKMCTEVDFDTFIVVHHEMGHIQYYLQYRNQPSMFRNGANPGFHEAIGDTIALSVATPKHLRKIGLVADYVENDRSDLNALMNMALEKIAFLPFGLLVDKWRWDVFSGAVSPDQWNSHWWEYRQQYQRIKAPVPRSDEHDFDPGAKYHVAADTQYISYFVSHILQFQLYKALCQEAGQYSIDGRQPLHRCDFYQSKRAGEKFSAGLSLGSSKHWSEVLEVMTGQKQLSASALLEYFEPLHKFLAEENLKYAEPSES